MNAICFGDSNTHGYDFRVYFSGRYDTDCRWVNILAAETRWVISNMRQNSHDSHEILSITPASLPIRV